MFRKENLKDRVTKRQRNRRINAETKALLNEIVIPNNLCSTVETPNNTLSSLNITSINNYTTSSPNSDEIITPEELPVVSSFFSESTTNVLDDFLDFQSSNFITACESVANNIDLTVELRNWALSGKVPQITVTKLLHILKPFHPEIPLECRTLLKTPGHIKTKSLSNGEYCHFGVVNVLKRILPLYSADSFITSANIIELSINVDGLPLFPGSSPLQFWPILGLIRNFSSKSFVIGVFYGRGKPTPLERFLEDFINEVLAVNNDGFTCNDQTYYLKIHSFSADCPARSYLKCIKGHGGFSRNAFNGSGKVILKGITAALRTEQSFIDRVDEEHHTGISPLLLLNFDMVQLFAIDYMHAVCLGVVKRILNIWCSGKNTRAKMDCQQISILSANLQFVKPFIPREIQRKPRPLDQLSFWKATEFRNFLLYYGPLILLKNIDISVYQHFLLLHVGITILVCSDHITNAALGSKFAQSCLSTFITHAEHIYTSQFYVYNVHILCHLDKEVEKFGNLDNFSCFPFENLLRILKLLIRSPKEPLQQLYHRLEETNYCLNVFPPENSDNFDADNGIDISLKKIKLKDFYLCVHSYSKMDAYCMVKNGKVMEVHKITKTNNLTITITGKEFLKYESLYDYPINSSELKIFKLQANNLSNIKYWELNDISAKRIVMPIKDTNYLGCFPLLHTL